MLATHALHWRLHENQSFKISPSVSKIYEQCKRLAPPAYERDRYWKPEYDSILRFSTESLPLLIQQYQHQKVSNILILK